MTEGRRSFLIRYAGIESGDECKRWQAVLNALVDGEASSEDLAALRPHLRCCGPCRATVRDLRMVRGSVAAVLPVPVVAAVAHGHHEKAAGLLARAWELLCGPLQERVAPSLFKLQAVVDTASAGKVAAVAASAAALAGGGVAIDRSVAEPAPGADRPQVVSNVATTAPDLAGTRSDAPGTIGRELLGERGEVSAEFGLAGRRAVRASAARREFAGAGHQPTETGSSRGVTAPAALSSSADIAAEFGP